MNTSTLHRVGSHRPLAVAAMLTAMVLLPACNSDKPVSGERETKPFSLIANGSSGRSYLNLDESEVHGYLSVSVARSLDSRWGGDFDQTSLSAMCGDNDDNPQAIVQATANGAALSQQGESNHIFVEDAPQSAIVPGTDVHWDVTLDGNVTVNDNIWLPPYPTIVNLTDYQSYSKSEGLTVTWNPGPDPNAEVVVSVSVDPIITDEEGGDLSNLNRDANRTLDYTETTNDNGSFVIPASELANFPDNVFVRVSTTTFNYVTKTRSDGVRYGLIASSQFIVPVKLVP